MKKILGIILVFTVLLSSSTIYASGLPQNSLSKWYGQSFQKESEKFNYATLTGVIEILKEISDFLVESKESISNSVTSLLDEQVKTSKSQIENYPMETKYLLDKTANELEKVSLDEYVDKAKIEDEIRQDIEKILVDVLSE